MDNHEYAYRRQLFTVRLWREELGNHQSAWWGMVICASDGERCAFRDWPDLIAFLEAKLKENEDGGEA